MNGENPLHLGPRRIADPDPYHVWGRAQSIYEFSEIAILRQYDSIRSSCSLKDFRIFRVTKTNIPNCRSMYTLE